MMGKLSDNSDWVIGRDFYEGLWWICDGWSGIVQERWCGNFIIGKCEELGLERDRTI